MKLVGPYLLKKESHCTTVLDQLLRDDTYTDVTLTAEGQSLRAHRIVLCLASPYFRQVLSREMNVQSVVLLRDVKFAELRNIINFIYTGEATVDATELESFMRTAEMLEISSLCEGQKCIASRGSQAQGGGGGGSSSSGFTIADFEKLVGAKRTRRGSSSPTPCKSIRLSGEDQSSRCSSAEPSANPLALIKEEPLDSAAPPTGEPADEASKTRDAEPDGADGGGRERRESSGSIGGFASIAGLQKEAPGGEGGEGGEGGAPEIFIATAESSLQAEEAEGAAAGNGPGRCPYCPHLTQKFEGVPMMRHLLVSHPCKPAFPCDSCWRVFVKRASFKSHQQKCQAQSF
ncbi:sex determination protein fruitless-like [Penaeus monodon]|uniref:sex determination protein fruitless-like n=1 Tax=Penaeus monodon TaxID=6687 RepID=UPI0018A7250B|nr:sex determination protein fruitless-like [Penaeus monodon]